MRQRSNERGMSTTAREKTGDGRESRRRLGTLVGEVLKYGSRPAFIPEGRKSLDRGDANEEPARRGNDDQSRLTYQIRPAVHQQQQGRVGRIGRVGRAANGPKGYEI